MSIIIIIFFYRYFSTKICLAYIWAAIVAVQHPVFMGIRSWRDLPFDFTRMHMNFDSSAYW